MRRIFIGAIAGVLVLAAVCVGIALTGFFNVAATHGDSPPIAWFLHTTYDRSVARHAAQVDVPLDYSTDESILIGARNFSAMCSGCHTPPESTDTPVAQGLNPPPPNLQGIAAQMTPAEQYWVIKNGVRMTGMPAFGPTHADSELWALVAFLQAIAAADAPDYQSLVAQAMTTLGSDDGHGHRHGPDAHADAAHESGHDHTDRQPADHHGDTPESAATAEHDHGSHDHGAHDHAAHSHAEPVAPQNPVEETADALHRALASGDVNTVSRLLAPNVLIFESGGVESSFEEYSGHHMPSDMAFLQKATRTVLSRESNVSTDKAWVATRSRLQADLGERQIDVISTETLSMDKTAEGWVVTHIHWSSSN